MRAKGPPLDDLAASRGVYSRLRIQGLSRGPALTFTDVHTMSVLFTIKDSTYIGRDALARVSNLGGGAIRTMLKKLKAKGFIGANASGCYLTRSGSSALETLSKTISGFPEVTAEGMTLGNFQVAVAVRGAGKIVTSGIEQRDSAIKLGASGATTYVMRKGRFTIPGGSDDCEKDFPGTVWAQLRSALRPRNGDALILCGASEKTEARLGALAAALSLL